MALTAAVLAILLQATATPEAIEAAQKRFQALETQVSAAIQARNTTALDALLAEDFAMSAFLAGRAPLVLNRHEWLQTAEHYTLSGFELRHLAVREFGNVAVVSLQPDRQATAGTSLDRSGEFAVVDVWTRDGKEWKLSSRHLSRPDRLPR